MRLAQVGAGIRRRAIWNKTRSCRFLVRSASYFSSPETPDNYRYPRTPGEIVRNRFTKKPLCYNQQRKNGEQKLMQTSAPASTLSSSAHSSSFRSIKAEGRFESTSPIHP